MNTKRNSAVMVAFGVTLVTASAACGSVFDGGWRVSVGAAYNAPAKVGLKFSPAKFSSGRVTPPAGYATRAEAERVVSGKLVVGESGKMTRRNYSADGKTFVDSDDARKARGGMEQGTWNVQVPWDSWNNGTFELASAEYVEVQNIQDGKGGLDLSGSDESAMPGVSVELSRNLYHNEEYHFGLDLAFMFSYFFRTDLYRSHSSAQTDAMRVSRGKLTSSVAPVSGTRESMWKDDEGYYGAGSYDGPGPVFNDPVITDVSLGSSVYRSVAGFSANGDFRELEMVLALRPYYDFFDWLRLYGTIGAAVSWSEFDLRVHSSRDGVSSSHTRDYDAWDVYGIGGLGLMVRWNDFTLGVDFFGRFLQDDLSIRDELVHGSLRRSTWMFRGMLGYEF